MAKKMLIDATHAEETRIAVVEGNTVEEFDFETESKRQLAGNIYLATITRIEPSLQAAFVDYGGNRHGFLPFSEIHFDYYQLPVEDIEALKQEELAYATAFRTSDQEDEESIEKTLISDKSKGDAEVSKLSENNSHVVVDEIENTTDSNNLSLNEDKLDESLDSEESNNATGRRLESCKRKKQTEFNKADQNQNKERDSSYEDYPIESISNDDDREEFHSLQRLNRRTYRIQEVIRVRRPVLVQVIKEERGNKGAALTTFISLAGRYCVLMPNTARGGGISRKIINAADRKKLKQIAAEINVPLGAGLIIRTAGAKRTRAELKRDYDYLQRLWNQVRNLTLNSNSPAMIYEEGNLIKRSIRDLYSREIDEVLVEGESGYRVAKDFMKMIVPSHTKKVKKYEDSIPLFGRYQVESFLNGMFNPAVQLKSGGYIVLEITEALVVIDVNSGRATREASIERTALKTNLEAAEEVARQLRLRDLAGLVVIDFIDMGDRDNNMLVEKRLKEKLKKDRARIRVGRISGFGLLEMSRQRLHPGMLEMITQPCASCSGTGLVRADDHLALSILRRLGEEIARQRTNEFYIKCPVNAANFLLNQKREYISQIETQYDVSIHVHGDSQLLNPDYSIERLKSKDHSLNNHTKMVISVESSVMDKVDSALEARSSDEPQLGEGDAKPKRRRRRRRRGRGRKGIESEVSTITSNDSVNNVDEESFKSDIDSARNLDKGKAENITETTAPDQRTEIQKPNKKRRGSAQRTSTKRVSQRQTKSSNVENTTSRTTDDTQTSEMNEMVRDEVALDQNSPKAVPEKKPRKRATTPERKENNRKVKLTTDQSEDQPSKQ